MKRVLLSFLSLVFISASIVFFQSCSTEDNTGPVITILGDNPLTIVLNDNNWVDPGATAEDDEDGVIDVIVDDSEVNPNFQAGYKIYYSAADEAGNESVAERVVNVVNGAEVYSGTYSADCVVPYPGGTSYPFTETISSSNTVNNRIIFANFGAYADCEVYGTVTGTTITIPSQTVNNVGNPPANRTFDGQGTINGTTITVNFNETVGGNSDAGQTIYIKQ